MTEPAFEHLAANPVPEIQRVDLAEVVLQLLVNSRAHAHTGPNVGAVVRQGTS
jgi:HrpA-like RNA helicase